MTMDTIAVYQIRVMEARTSCEEGGGHTGAGAAAVGMGPLAATTAAAAPAYGRGPAWVPSAGTPPVCKPVHGLSHVAV